MTLRAVRPSAFGGLLHDMRLVMGMGVVGEAADRSAKPRVGEPEWFDKLTTGQHMGFKSRPRQQGRFSHAKVVNRLTKQSS